MEYIARPSDSRCKFWSKVVRATDSLPPPSSVDGAGSIPGPYLRTGADVELEDGDFVFEGEEVSHRKSRGWVYNFGIVLGGQIRWISDDERAQAKDLWRLVGRRDMTAGSGEHAAMVRAAHWLRGAACGSL